MYTTKIVNLDEAVKRAQLDAETQAEANVGS